MVRPKKSFCVLYFKILDNRLNEGYATVFEYLLVEREYPALRMRDLFNVIKVQGAFRPDALESSHPMTFNGQTQSLIIYDKGNAAYYTSTIL